MSDAHKALVWLRYYAEPEMRGRLEEVSVALEQAERERDEVKRELWFERGVMLDLQNKLVQVDALLADPSGSPLDAINLARKAIAE